MLHFPCQTPAGAETWNATDQTSPLPCARISVAFVMAAASNVKEKGFAVKLAHKAKGASTKAVSAKRYPARIPELQNQGLGGRVHMNTSVTTASAAIPAL